MKWQQILNSKQFPWVLLGLGVFPFFVLAFFTSPVSDDYAFFGETQTRSFWEFLSWGFNHISGRYTAIAFTKLINPVGSTNFLYYNLFSVAILAGFIHAGYVFVKAATVRIGINQNNALIAIIMVLYWLLLMPNMCEMFYWYSSANSYSIGIIALFYWGTAYVRLGNGVNNMFYKYGLIAVLCILPVVIIGTCEVALILMGLVLAALLLYYVANKKYPPKYFYLIAFISAASAGISVLAPGNFNRKNGVAELFNTAPINNLSFTVDTTFGKTLEIWADFFLLNLATLFIILILAIITPTYKPTEQVKKLAKYMLFGSLVVIPMLLFPYYWSTGIAFIPLRIIDYAFMAFSIVYIPALYIYYKPYFGSSWQKPAIKYGVVAITLAFILVRTNYRYAVQDLLNIKTYSTEVANRYSILESSAGKDVVFAPLSYKPNTILHMDLDSKASHWYNRSLAKYYGVKSVSLKK